MYFQNYGVPKTRLDQCLKSPISEHPSKTNMVIEPKHCSNLKDSSFTIFIDNCAGKYLTKSFC